MSQGTGEAVEQPVLLRCRFLDFYKGLVHLIPENVITMGSCVCMSSSEIR